MKSIKFIRFTYNGGKVIEVTYRDYLINQDYWSDVPAIKEVIYNN